MERKLLGVSPGHRPRARAQAPAFRFATHLPGALPGGPEHPRQSPSERPGRHHLPAPQKITCASATNAKGAESASDSKSAAAAVGFGRGAVTATERGAFGRCGES
ncbi:hypothetical protein GCM10011415_25880 [Salipiger pallidus]|uniref:Uncharacterized protein n=1 Tax=Salipiger pallidus TaxID=1775170 RepID=A0A8J2ZL17_9RHOB|nr:hypothetical protein GCM10011415_25880 [Salipiger pallidus]